MASKHVLQRVDSNSDLIEAKKAREGVKRAHTASSSDDDTGAGSSMSMCDDCEEDVPVQFKDILKSTAEDPVRYWRCWSPRWDDLSHRPLYYEPMKGCCSIDNLTDGLLLKIFKELGAHTLVEKVDHVCKRWKRLSTDKSLWSEVNLQIFGGLTGGKVKKKLQTYCDASLTKKVSISARSRRRNALNEWDAKSMIWTWWDEEARKRKLATKSICFTPLVLKELRDLTSLKEFYIKYDSICKVDLFDCLPSTLTHLTLSRCNISLDKFNNLMSTECALTCLKFLDLTDLQIIGFKDLSGRVDDRRLGKSSPSILPTCRLPQSLEKFVISETYRLMLDEIFLGVITRSPELKSIDISINEISYRDLVGLSKSLTQLETLRMCGCRLKGKLDPDWEEIWTEGFPALKKLNVRNVAWDDYMNTYADRLRDVIMNSVYEIVSTERIPWLIDTDGRRTSSVGKNEDWQDDLERLKLSPNLPNNLPEEKPLLGEPFDEDSIFYW